MNPVAAAGRHLLATPLLILDADQAPLPEAGLLIEDGRVRIAGPLPELQVSWPELATRRLPGDVALPGLIDAHSHGRGLPLSAHDLADDELEFWLARLPAMTALDPADQASCAAEELLGTGVTGVQAFLDHPTTDPGLPAYARAVLAAWTRVGVRASVVPGIVDRNPYLPPNAEPPPGPPGLRAAWHPDRHADLQNWLAAHAELTAAASGSRPGGGLAPALGPVAPQWCSDAVLVATARAVRDQGARVHCHLLESPRQRAAHHPETPVARLARHGLLGPWLSVAHAVHLSPPELELLVGAGVTLVHCPGSNTRLGCGRAPVRRWSEAGAAAAIGIDNNALTEPADVFAELRHAGTLAAERGEPVSERLLLTMATRGGAQAVGAEGQIGTLQEGALADLVTLALPGVRACEDPVAKVVREAQRTCVREVLVGGVTVFAGGQVEAHTVCNAARQRLRAALGADAAARRGRIATLAAGEPWLRAAWAQAEGRAQP